MNFEQMGGIPPETVDQQPPAENNDPVNNLESNELARPEPSVPESEKTTAPESSVEKFKPTPENPIEEIRIGLWYKMDQYFHATRVIMKLKDGTFADMPWEQAEAILPPEFRTARELGESGRDLGRQVTDLITAIQAKTDVMHRSGHVKDALLGLVGQTRKPLQYLNEAGALYDELSDVAQQSFLELRRMANSRESHAEALRNLMDRFTACQKKFDDLKNAVFQDKPSVHEEYERYRNHPAARLNRGEVTKEVTAEELPESNDNNSLS